MALAHRAHGSGCGGGLAVRFQFEQCLHALESTLQVVLAGLVLGAHGAHATQQGLHQPQVFGDGVQFDASCCSDPRPHRFHQAAAGFILMQRGGKRTMQRWQLAQELACEEHAVGRLSSDVRLIDRLDRN